jgi:hypothetical protein
MVVAGKDRGETGTVTKVGLLSQPGARDGGGRCSVLVVPCFLCVVPV